MRIETEFVAFLDGDDWMNIDAIQKLYDNSVKYCADIVACKYYYEKPLFRTIVNFINRKVLLEGNNIIKCYIIGRHIGQVAWNKLYRKEIFSNIRYPVGMVFEDIATTCKTIMKSKRIVGIPDVLFHYRVRENSISKSISVNCINDYWKANYEKYLLLSQKICDFKCVQLLLCDCINAIHCMWCCYGGFTSEEKHKAESTLNEMNNFIDKYRYSVLFGDYSLYNKIVIICTISKNPIYMFIINRLYRLLKNLKIWISPRYK